MYICSNNNSWFTNVGEAFIDLGVKAIVHNLEKKNAAIHYACVSSMSSTYLPKSVGGRVFKNSNFYEPDVLFLAGMYATSGVFTDDGTSIAYEYAKELRKKGKQVAFIGVGGKTYTDKERDDVLRGMKLLNPLFIVTRDKKTYDLYSNYFECRKGLDCAFWLNDEYNPVGLEHKNYIVSTFNRSDEPLELTEREYYVHPWHFQYTLDESKTRYLSKNNLFVSDSPYEYLTLYANADKVYTDMVHATIPSLVYGTPVKYYKIDDRRNAFESLDYIHKDEYGFLTIDKNLLLIEKKQIENYVLNKIQQII